MRSETIVISQDRSDVESYIVIDSVVLNPQTTNGTCLEGVLNVLFNAAGANNTAMRIRRWLREVFGKW